MIMGFLQSGLCEFVAEWEFMQILYFLIKLFFSRLFDRTLSKLKLVYHSYRASSLTNKEIVNCQVALVLIIDQIHLELDNP